MTLDYFDSSHVHAVTNANSNTYSYDANGNQVTRHIANDTFNLIYDAENRLVEVKRNNATIALFTYDGDGKRVKSVMDGETILFVGGHFEQKGSTVTKYYFAGASRIALRKYTVPQSMTVEYMLGDHLGSTSITTDTAGAKISELRYKAWGETRYTWTNAPVTTPTYEFTKYQFTGQYSYTAEFGLHFYGARFYDSGVGRFISPDSLVPGTNNSQSWDRFAYVGNNPVKNTDPDGHCYPLCTMAIGALVGAIVGGTTYAITNRGNFNPNEFAVAVGAGVIAGGLIGTGVGILAAGATAGVASSAAAAATVATASQAISAGTAASMTGMGYMINNPNEFETLPFALQTGTAGIAGAVSSNPTVDPLLRLGANVASAEVGYFTNGEESHSFGGAVITANAAMAGSALQVLGDSYAEDLLMINRPSDLLNSPMGNIRTNVYGTFSGISTTIVINAGSGYGACYDTGDCVDGE